MGAVNGKHLRHMMLANNVLTFFFSRYHHPRKPADVRSDIGFPSFPFEFVLSKTYDSICVALQVASS